MKLNRNTIDPQRSAIMRAVKSKDTQPELAVRRFVHGLGFRYRLHCKNLPGKPDLVFSKLKCVIFVNGCFWHGHPCPRGNRKPKTGKAYWRDKIGKNVDRDRRHLRELRKLGWRVLVVWECDLNARRDAANVRILKFLQRAVSTTL